MEEQSFGSVCGFIRSPTFWRTLGHANRSCGTLMRGCSLRPPQISHGIELSRALRARSSSSTRIWWSHCRWTKRISTLPRIRPACQPLRAIREQIRQELSLTASAGVAPNKFLANLASDWRKPDGLFVIQPEEVGTFLLPLPVGRLPGVGKVTEEKLEKLGIKTVSNLRGLDLPMLEGQFGRYGVRLYELSRGIDNSQVVPNRPPKSISAEDTFERDVLLSETEPMIRTLTEKVWSASRKELRVPRTVVLKLKTSDFNILTRSHTPSSPPSSCEELTTIALALRERVELSTEQRFRLVGIGLSNFREPEATQAQPALFE